MNIARDQSIARTTMGRRSFLGAAAIGCACCEFPALALADNAPHASAGSTPPHWAYEGRDGAAHWGELSPAFKTCELGLEQSPIDLADATSAQLGGLDISYHRMPLHILNNGHTIQVNAMPDASCSCMIGGTKFALQQFHFHHPSEHLLSGKSFDLECHFVHRSAAGDLAVIGVLLRPGEANPALQPIWSAMPKHAGPEVDLGSTIDAMPLLPADRDHFYRYKGSLTTPPCTQGIIWTVMREPIEASPAQIRQFAELFTNNARPVQPRNRRDLLLQSS